MPFLTVYTNSKPKENDNIAELASSLVAEVLHKPISYVAVNFIYNPTMAFGGSSSEKGALVELLSIGLGNKDELVDRLTDFLADKLEITNLNNICISLNNAPASQVASGGHTFG
ncbi:MAG: hypothetical protein IKW58_02295 [Alphaproteobacteria bacterium]|nr:hypothetical protein [Alphaproteobacteria bacterium]